MVLMVLPLGKSGEPSDAPQVGVVEALFAAQSAMADMGSFCERRAETCDTGRKIAGEVAVRAKEAARLAYLYLDNKTPSMISDDAIKTGSVK